MRVPKSDVDANIVLASAYKASIRQKESAVF
jgi:hypothetical protein